jgi:hypothetical protein
MKQIEYNGVNSHVLATENALLTSCDDRSSRNVAHTLTLLDLPNEVMLIILDWLLSNPTDVYHTLMLSRRLYFLTTQTDALWRILIRQSYQPQQQIWIEFAHQQDPANIPVVPQRDVYHFIAYNLSRSGRCLRCGIEATNESVLGPLGSKSLIVFKQRYCRHCIQYVLTSSTTALSDYMLLASDLEDARLRCITTLGTRWDLPTVFFLKRSVECLALKKFGSWSKLANLKRARDARKEEEQGGFGFPCWGRVPYRVVSCSSAE